MLEGLPFTSNKPSHVFTESLCFTVNRKVEERLKKRGRKDVSVGGVAVLVSGSLLGVTSLV